MRGWRCPECGETRWSFFGAGPSDPVTCPLCDGPMVAERRLPGHGLRRELERERRREFISQPGPPAAPAR